MSQRWKNFCWKTIQNALPTKDNLVKRAVEIDPTCVFCGERETTDHLFLSCEITRRIWSSSVLGLRIPSYPTPSFPMWFKNMFTYLQRTSVDSNRIWPYLVAVTWAIWIHRNNIIFRKEDLNPRAILSLADAVFERWYKGFGDNKGREQTDVYNLINRGKQPPGSGEQIPRGITS
ncbi:Bacterial non-heme ferritin [Bienertia sinuspersici]